jgi:hypothetical protein
MVQQETVTRYNLHAEMLTHRLKMKIFGAMMLVDDEKTCFYTGLVSYSIFHGVFSLLMKQNRRYTALSLEDELFLVLVKLRLAMSIADMAYRMYISISAVSRIFRSWMMVMSTELAYLIEWPDDGKLNTNMPTCFKKHFSQVRCIIDCFELFIERPVSFQARALTYSHYKKHNTLKFLIAVSPTGLPTGSICFISKAWGGCVSDKVITQQYGFLNYLNFGDEVLADRGFNIQDDLAVCGA